MKILHTADWHLGKQLHGQSLFEDQAHVLEQIVGIAEQEKPEAIIIAGDVYDRAVPPPESITLFDDTIRKLREVSQKAPILAIAGNHDGPERLTPYSDLLDEQGLHLHGRYDGRPRVVPLSDKDGPVHFHLLPYLYPSEVRVTLDNSCLQGHDQATEAALGPHLDYRSKHSEDRHVLIGHAFVAGGSESDSERPLSIGNSGVVPSRFFEAFDYVALGHLHEPQQVDHEKIRYSGSLLKYSFSEVDHEKSVSLVDLGAGGALSLKTIATPGKRDLRILEGPLEELLATGFLDPDRDDYLHAELTDSSVLLEPMARLRQVYPNLLSLRTNFDLVDPGESDRLSPEDLKQDDLTLFRSFYEQASQLTLSDDQAEAFSEIVESLEL